MTEEIWATIPEFPNYSISSYGRIYNHAREIFMRVSVNNFGHVKVSLKGRGHYRPTRSVAQLVAEAFVEPPNARCNQVVVLDGDFANLYAENLAWRPVWFAWKYTRQLKTEQPIHYQNLRVLNTVTGDEYESICHAGMVEGLLFEDIWRSTYRGTPCYPHGSVFEILPIQ